MRGWLDGSCFGGAGQRPLSLAAVLQLRSPASAWRAPQPSLVLQSYPSSLPDQQNHSQATCGQPCQERLWRVTTSRSASTTRLILIRHAHTASNGGQASVLSGRTDVPLSARGLVELQQLQLRLRGTTPFDAIYTSPLRRAAETAIVLEQAGLGPVRVYPGLQEIDCGTLDGMSLDQVQRSYPELWQANQRQADCEFRWPGGESYREFRRRCLTAVRTLTREHPRGCIAMVTHAGVISQIVGFVTDASPAQWGRYRVGNTALTEVHWEGSRGRLVRFNDRHHLHAAAEPRESTPLSG
ncbi:MAG TPA: histidine phosphatase family protein [Gemmatimonadales bacterium]|nr:histidine phosphatase family protein [Gemmatimonadales bacterium]